MAWKASKHSFPNRLHQPRSHKYSMRPLQNILHISQFSSLMEGKDNFSDLPWWDDCIYQVKMQLLSDKTTTLDNLRQKARDYTSNYIAIQTEFPYIQKDQFLDAVVDQIEKDLDDVTFDQRPLASVAAQRARASIQEDPEKRFIKLK